MVLHKQMFLGVTPRLVFVFSTRGMQWAGMGQQLYEEEPVFRKVLELCDLEIQQHLGWSLLEEFVRSPETYRLHTSEERLEVALVAIQIALSEVWRSRGICPSAVVGMSVGEFTAAYVAGVLSLEDTMKVACSVNRVLSRRLGMGRMILVNLSLEQAEALRHIAPKPVYIAAEYAPSMTILSGKENAIEEFLTILSDRRISYWQTQSDFAFHSPLFDHSAEVFMRPLCDLRPSTAALPIYSSVTGGLLRQASYDASHWWRVFRMPALYARVVSKLIRDGYNTFLEIGLHPVLSEPIRELASIHNKQVTILPSMKRNRPTSSILEKSLQTLRSIGITTPLSAHQLSENQQKVDASSVDVREERAQ